MSTLSTHIGETIGIILLWAALIAAFVWFLKYKEIKRSILKKQVDNIHRSTEALRICFDDLCVTNGFTALLDKTFRAENWTIVPQTQVAEFRTRNPFGEIFGLNAYCSVFRSGEKVYQFNRVVPSIGDTEDIYIKARINEAFAAQKDWKQILGLKKDHYSVGFRTYEFYIPESNPLYYDDEVRAAVGAKPAEKKRSPMEQFSELRLTLPDDMAAYAGHVERNVAKAAEICEDSAESKLQIELFIEKYIPLMNEMIRNYNQQDDRARNKEELIHTMKILAAGADKLVDKVRANDERDTYKAQASIEQQLFEDGLYDPSMDLIDKYK